MRQLRYLAATLLLSIGLLVPVGGFSQGRGNRSEHRTTTNNHRGGGNANRGHSNRGKEIKVNPDRGKVNRDHGNINKNKHHDRNPNRGPVHVNPRPNPRPNPGLHHGKKPIVRPHAGYRPSYVGRPFGSWGRPLPPPPRRPARRYYASAPLIDFGLGLVYGSLLNAGVSTLINAGINVAATVNNAIYLSNVIRYGVTWPQVTMYYDSGRLSGARYQYGSPYTNYGVYDDVYRQLVRAYGSPLSVDYNGASRTATWWGGGSSGYVTLSFAPGYDNSGEVIYYTDLLYGQ